MCYSAMLKQKSKLLGIDIQIRTDVDTWEEFERLQSQDPASFKLSTDGRVFPKWFGPVLIFQNDEFKYLPMRYELWPSNFKEEPKNLSLFNARRDNLLKSNVWNRLIGKNHGLVCLERFYEWVEVRDLVSAGVISLKEVEKKFEAIELEKKKKALAAGKKYKATPTALKKAIDRKIEISFFPETTDTILAPVIFDVTKMENGDQFYSFALITDEPQPEVAAAGHDRSPVFLNSAGAIEWLNSEGKSPEDIIATLDKTKSVLYKHAIAA